MPVHVRELTTEVHVEPAEGAVGGDARPGRPPDWEETARLRVLRVRLEANEARTRADGFHD